MKDQIEKLILSLKIHIKNNLEIINKNQKRINELIKSSFTKDTEKEYENLKQVNKILMNENDDCINLQIVLSNFLNKYRFSEFMNAEYVTEVSGYLNEEEIYYLTINEKIPINISHPAFKNEDLLKKILDYFTKCENYEKCNEILNLMKKTLQH